MFLSPGLPVWRKLPRIILKQTNMPAIINTNPITEKQMTNTTVKLVSANSSPKNKQQTMSENGHNHLFCDLTGKKVQNILGLESCFQV